MKGVLLCSKYWRFTRHPGMTHSNRYLRRTQTRDYTYFVCDVCVRGKSIERNAYLRQECSQLANKKDHVMWYQSERGCNALNFNRIIGKYIKYKKRSMINLWESSWYSDQGCYNTLTLDFCDNNSNWCCITVTLDQKPYTYIDCVQYS